MTPRADVYKNRVLAGRLEREAGSTVFSYDHEHSSSCSLPRPTSRTPSTPEFCRSARATSRRQ